jgi:hypothetical protein
MSAASTFRREVFASRLTEFVPGHHRLCVIGASTTTASDGVPLPQSDRRTRKAIVANACASANRWRDVHISFGETQAGQR